MKIVFFGSSDFALFSLEILLDSAHEVLACVTQPDRQKGRQLKIQPTPVKNLAASKNIKLHQPEQICDCASLKFLRSLSADLFVVVSFGQILSKDILDIPRFYSINLHPSLLPKYRGAAPVNWAIIKGETETGLSVIKMNEKMDAGDVLIRRKVKIENTDTSETLIRRLSELGGVLLSDTIRFIEKGKITFTKQNDNKATFAPRLKKEDGLIAWNKSALEIHNQVRGTMPWPGAYTFLDGKILKIWKSQTVRSHEKKEPGMIIGLERHSLLVTSGKDLLIVKELQLEGGKRMDVASFMRGHKLENGMFLGMR